MARTLLADRLQAHCFYLMDVFPIESIALPVFSPLLGFSSITAPELTLETTEVREGNWFFPRKVVKGGTVRTMTVMRGAVFYDADFYKWVMATLLGDTTGRRWFGTGISAISGPTPRRRLVLIQFLPRSPASLAVTTGLAVGGLLALAGGAGGTTAIVPAGIAATRLGATAFQLGSGNGSIGPFEFAPRIPAKAWILHGCLPSRYKAAGDFEATNAEVSQMELDIESEGFEEISLSV